MAKKTKFRVAAYLASTVDPYMAFGNLSDDGIARDLEDDDFILTKVILFKQVCLAIKDRFAKLDNGIREDVLYIITAPEWLFRKKLARDLETVKQYPFKSSEKEFLRYQLMEWTATGKEFEHFLIVAGSIIWGGMLDDKELLWHNSTLISYGGECYEYIKQHDNDAFSLEDVRLAMTKRPLYAELGKLLKITKPFDCEDFTSSSARNIQSWLDEKDYKHSAVKIKGSPSCFFKFKSLDLQFCVETCRDFGSYTAMRELTETSDKGIADIHLVVSAGIDVLTGYVIDSNGMENRLSKSTIKDGGYLIMCNATAGYKENKNDTERFFRHKAFGVFHLRSRDMELKEGVKAVRNGKKTEFKYEYHPPEYIAFPFTSQVPYRINVYGQLFELDQPKIKGSLKKFASATTTSN